MSYNSLGLKNDVIFKYVFGHPKNKYILLSLLNALLGYDYHNKITDIKLLNPLNLKEYLDDKFSILDIKAKDNQGRQYNIELQIQQDRYFIPRVIYYHDKLFVEQLGKSESYEKLNKTISISILNYVL
ncbi:MAG TPA: Rpn family recombination-promoting nuclease/putative transposase, partial [bacterium]|nr:Rpn family recombination-promoting nuclease/putative transposase [bacterium]